MIVKKLRYLIPACAFFLTEPLFANGLPTELGFIKDGNGSRSVTYIDSLNEEQRRFFWKNTTRNSDGYLDIESNEEYVTLLPVLLSRWASGPKNPSGIFRSKVSLNKLPQLEYLGEFAESKHRANLFFRDTVDRLSMLTIWDYEADGAQLVIVEEFLNVTIHGSRATLSFVKAPNIQEGLWKLSWLKAKLQFELYVSDGLDSQRRPIKSKKEILTLARNLVSPPISGASRIRY